jgi:hypothetical protein
VSRGSAKRRRVRIVGFLSAVFACAVALGQPSRHFDLTWLAPAGCPDAPDVTREIDELVASSSANPPRSAILANAMVAADEGGFTLILSIRDNEGLHQRKLEAPNCSELGHATALIVALAIDPALLATRPEPRGTNAGTSVAAPSSAPPASVPPPPAVMPAPSFQVPPSVPRPYAESNAPLVWRLGLVEFVGIHTLPGINLGTGLFGGLQLKSWRLEAMASELSGTKSKTPKRGAEFSLYRFATRGCWLMTGTQWALGPCAGVEVGLLRGEGHGYDVPGTPKGLWLGSTAGALFDWRLGSSSVLGFVADAEIPWIRDYFALGLDNKFYRPPPAAARIGVSLSAGWQ